MEKYTGDFFPTLSTFVEDSYAERRVRGDWEIKCTTTSIFVSAVEPMSHRAPKYRA